MCDCVFVFSFLYTYTSKAYIWDIKLVIIENTSIDN